MAARQDGPNLSRLYSINRDGSHNTLHPADVRGRFMTARRWVYAVLIAIYGLTPLWTIGGHPAVQLDIAARRFYLFGQTYNSQDAWILVFLVTSAAFSLLFITAWLGRVWCGWACPQTVFLEGVYRRIERWVEGPREARLRRATAPLSLDKAWRKAVKHILFLAVSLALAHVFIGYFVSLPELWKMVRADPRSHLQAFVWVMVVTAVLYAHFSWFREQLCIVICPYGRLQSVLTDRRSLVIGYDRSRGEPRGKLTRAAREAQDTSGGDCIDCNRCVTACPTGIDIRDGLQLECIACAQCIDACDDVMKKVGRAPGLIRYDSEEGLSGTKSPVVRPRLAAYATLLALAGSGLTVSLFTRSLFEANLLRIRGAPYELEGDEVRNQFELHLINKNPGPSTLTVTPGGDPAARFVLPRTSVTLDSLESFRLPIFVSLPRSQFHGGAEVELTVDDGASGQRRKIEARLLGPTLNPGVEKAP